MFVLAELANPKLKCVLCKTQVRKLEQRSHFDADNLDGCSEVDATGPNPVAGSVWRMETDDPDPEGFKQIFDSLRRRQF